MPDAGSATTAAPNAIRRLAAASLLGAVMAVSAAPTAQATGLTIIQPPPQFKWVGRIIRQDFKPLGWKNYKTAMCVANRESGFDPDAYNPDSGASGVYQFIPTSWAYYSEKAGYGGESPFKARANVGTAAWVVQHVGWSPWGGGCS